MKVAIRVFIAMLLVIAGGLGAYWVVRHKQDTYEVERTKVQPATVSDLLSDDDPKSKTPKFDPALFDSRPFGAENNRWQINASAALLALDVPDIRDDQDAGLLKLYPGYAKAAKALVSSGRALLPSVNVIGAKAKQFDDGLYAALDLHMASNREHDLQSIEVLLRQIMVETDPRSEAYGWICAALEVGGHLSGDEAARRPERTAFYVNAFRARGYESDVVGFYEWSPELQNTFRFLRFLQQDFPVRAGLPDALLRAMQKNPGCMDMYQHMLGFYSRLTNPLDRLNLLDLVGTADDVPAIAARKGVIASLHFLPYSGTKETELFNQLYPQGLRAGADLMVDFIKAIRSGSLDLKPGENSGWYDYQLYALESFVLPERGAENNKLVLSKKYKLHLIESFKAMVTKHRETHIRQAGVGAAANSAGGGPGAPDERLAPRLRVEPNPTYFLRYARGYAFLQKFLVGQVADLNALYGARDGGWRKLPLGDELEEMRLLFYGLHLVSCEDIGMKDELLDAEVENKEYARALAAKWLQNWQGDPDLAIDTRVAVPIYFNFAISTRFWATIGVRAVPLHVRWETEPSWRPMAKEGEAPGEWQKMEWRNLDHGNYLLLVDEFAEFERRGSVTLPRTELRKICDGAATKPEILKALQD